MAISIFEDKQKKPEHNDVIEILGEKEVLWNRIRNYIISNYPGSEEEWKYYGKSSGWTLILKQKKRTILYLFPNYDLISVLFVYGDRAVKEAFENEFPQYILERIESAKPYMEGRSFFVEVKSQEDIGYIEKLIHIKMYEK